MVKYIFRSASELPFALTPDLHKRVAESGWHRELPVAQSVALRLMAEHLSQLNHGE